MKSCVWYGLWLQGHNNKRYAELLPRLQSVHRIYNRLSPNRVLRKLQFLGHEYFAPAFVYPTLFGDLSKRYDFLFSTNTLYAQWFDGPVIVDLDDPVFTDEETRLLSLPNVIAVVTTTEAIKNRLHQGKIDCPIHIIPQGITLSDIDQHSIRLINTRHKRRDQIVVGLSQPFLLLDSDVVDTRKSNRQMYNIQLLVRAMDIVRERAPHVVLWLLGHPSKSLKDYASKRPWIRLFGFVEPKQLLNHVSCFDIGAYARATDLSGRSSIKLIENMGCGVPTVATSVAEACVLEKHEAGILTDPTAAAFADGLLRLIHDIALRERLAIRAREAGLRHDWDVLANRYQHEVFDRYLSHA